MAHNSEADLDTLELCLREGIASNDYGDARAQLGCSADADDREVARALVRLVAAGDIEQIGTQSINPEAARHPSVRPPTAVAADPSFLGRLSTSGADGLSVERIDDLPTILAVLRAGSRRQRRAALDRLRKRLGDRRLLHSDAVRKAIQTIAGLRDVELGQELAQSRAELPGTQGRQARHEHDQWKRLAQQVESAIRAFWDGQSNVEPIQGLPGDQRALLLMRISELPDVVVHHLSAIIEGNDGWVPFDSRIGLISSLRYATDPRLVPALISVVEAERGELVARAARVLGGIDDARIHPALAERFERSFVNEERIGLAGALGMHGDCRGLTEVRNSLREDQPQLLLQALEAMETLGSPEHTAVVAKFLDHSEVAVATQAVRTAARIGDGFLCTGGIGLDLYAQALAKNGKTSDQGKAVLGCWAIIAEDPEAEAARLGEHILYQSNEYITWGAFGPPDETPLFPDASAAIENGLYELWDADTAVAKLSQLKADFPMLSDIHFWAQFPGESHESGTRRMQYIADKVLPRLR